MMALGGFRARAALMGVCGVAVLGFAGASAQAATVGVDCVKPVNLFGSNQDLSSRNLNGVTISGEGVLTGSNLTGAKLNEATLSGVRALEESNLSGASLVRATISGEEALSRSTLTGAKLNEATISGTNEGFGSNLTGASLKGATISGKGALSEFSNLTGATLKGAKITPGIGVLAEAIYSNTVCPDGTNSDNDGGTCVGHGV